MPKVTLLEGPATFAALRHTQQKLNFMLSTCHPVYQMDVVNVGSPVDRVVFRAFLYYPAHRIYPVVPSLTINRPPLPPMPWPPPVDPEKVPPETLQVVPDP